MNRHPTDAEILDAIAPGRAPSPEVRAHLEACAECRARIEAERPLSERLSGLPRESDPPRDLWPGVLERIEAEPRGIRARPPRRRPASRRALRAAAAIALFLAGGVAGRALPRGGSPERGAPGDPLAAAAEVQRAGTAYVAALADFRAAASDAPGVTVAQARDVALAAVYGAAWELERLAPGDATARGIVALAEDDRAEEAAP